MGGPALESGGGLLPTGDCKNSMCALLNYAQFETLLLLSAIECRVWFAAHEKYLLFRRGIAPPPGGVKFDENNSKSRAGMIEQTQFLSITSNCQRHFISILPAQEQIRSCLALNQLHLDPTQPRQLRAPTPPPPPHHSIH